MNAFKSIALQDEARVNELLNVMGVSYDELSTADVVDAVSSGITDYDEAISLGLIYEEDVADITGGA